MGAFSYLKMFDPWSCVWGLFVDLPLFPLALLMSILGRFAPNDDIFRRWRYHDGRPRVVLVHGSGANAYQWLITGLFYLVSNFDLYTIDLGPDANLEKYSERLQALLSRLALKSPDPISIIGCSMGGLASAHAAENTTISTVASVVTVGAPFQGAPGLLHTTHLQTTRHADMMPGSLFLTDLTQQMHKNASWRKCKYLFFGGRRDLLVPDAYSFPEGFEEHHRTHNYGHWTPMLYPQIWGDVIYHIKLSVQQMRVNQEVCQVLADRQIPLSES